MADAVELPLLPEWRQAVKDFFKAQFKAGDIVQRAWLESHFGMAVLDEKKPLLPADWNSRQFVWLRNLDAFRAELLEKHQIYLSNVVGEGYRIVPPAEQTSIAQEKFEREAKKSYRVAANTLKNVRLCELTDEQRKENLDAIAKLSMLRGMNKAVME
ncbi:MAG: hypothetical protein K2X55_04060, partial [Burkholderiaceae bacterium]|nr:hypothetical protein [Burkholderiaceae bacterium]